MKEQRDIPLSLKQYKSLSDALNDQGKPVSALLSRGAAFVLVLLGSLLYFAVAVIEWRLGSAYHAGLALALAALFVFTGRGGRITVGTALMLGAVLAYGIYRAVVGLSLLGLL